MRLPNLLHLIFFASIIFSVMTAPAQLIDNYSDETARKLVYFAAASYCINYVKTWNFTSTCSSSLFSFKPLGTFYDFKTDAFAYVAVNEEKKMLVAGIKGTDPDHIRDWIDDLKTGFKYNTLCKLAPVGSSSGVQFNGHPGFCAYYLSIRQSLMATVRSALQTYGRLDVYITGHSLGGAAAAIHMLDILYNLPSSLYSSIQLYTYGEPRVGDVSLTTLFQAQSQPRIEVYRVIHHLDPVPHLPFCCEVLDRPCSNVSTCPFHEPMEAYYANEMKSGASFKECSLVDGEDNTCSNGNVLDWDIDDHLYYFGLEVGENCCY